MVFKSGMLRKCVVVLSSLAIPFAAMPSLAHAEDTPEVSVEAYAGYTEEEFQELLKEAAQELFDSELPREVVEEGDELFIVYQFEDGGEIGMPARLTHPQPRIRVGPAIKGPWVELTPTEQRMLIAGQEAALVRLICRASPQGRGICSIATILAASIFVYLSENGTCPNDQRLLVELTWGGNIRGTQCR